MYKYCSNQTEAPSVGCTESFISNSLQNSSLMLLISEIHTTKEQHQQTLTEQLQVLLFQKKKVKQSLTLYKYFKLCVLRITGTNAILFNYPGSCEIHQHTSDWLEFSPFYAIPKAILFTSQMKTVWQTRKKFYYVDSENFNAMLSQRC